MVGKRMIHKAGLCKCPSGPASPSTAAPLLLLLNPPLETLFSSAAFSPLRFGSVGVRGGKTNCKPKQDPTRLLSEGTDFQVKM